ncbi:Hypothetical predicted protein, partial [Paramuricea clavata]
MANEEAKLDTKLTQLRLTAQRTWKILDAGKRETIERHLKALQTTISETDQCKRTKEDLAEISDWNTEIEAKIGEAEDEVNRLQQWLESKKMEEENYAREEQLKFEVKLGETKLQMQAKIQDANPGGHNTSKTETGEGMKAVTETWLREDDNEFSTAEICPTGYHFYHITRKNARGGGLEKPPLEQAEIYYRKLNNVNMDSFNEDLKVLDLNDDYDLSVLIDKYENTLKETLQQHAPQKRRIITLRPLSPWYNEEIGQEKRNRRKLERRWRASGLYIDRQLYVKQCETVNAMIKNAKTTYYSSVISSNAHNQKVLFSTVDKLLHRKPEKRYPTASSTTELVNKFSDFFNNKIAIIWKELAIDSSHCNQRNQEEQYAQCVKFINFQEVTEHEIENVIDKVGKKSCELDPVPAKIFQGCQKTLLPIITKISNKSLQSGCMPEILKEAVLKPKLKKDSLDYEEYTNFRPISNLKFLSKVIEKVAAGQLLEHLANNKLEEPFQSAYKRFHSAETTLLKVQNDILVAIDNRKCVVLLLLDMSTAFDTVDHELLLQRMFKRFGIDGQVLRWFQSYLQNRTQSVVIDGVKSISKDLRCGVPQGS